jgi:phosphoenolpyruvate-protein kinase (PTS system EI component)
MDIGGDKGLADALGGEDHSLLGMRGIRRSLRDDDLFLPQLRGLLRASVHGELRIVLPFVTQLAEVQEARARIRDAARALRRDGVAVADEIPVGVMLEVPAATLIVDQLADHVDFFSVGTNDLIQYLLAVDRANDAVAHLYEPLHPGVLRVLDDVAKTARARGKPVSICGEVAADPLTAMVLLGLGFSELSMTPGSIPVIRSLVQRLPMVDAREIAAEALSLRNAAAVEEFALARLMAHCPDGFLATG